MAEEPTILGGGPEPGLDLSSTIGAGGALQIAGVVVQSIGAFYAAESQKTKLESDALTFDFQRTIANINARAAEQDAAAILEAGRRRSSLSQLRSRQAIGLLRTTTAARGVQAGVGSAAELTASARLAAKVDAYAIDAGTLRAVTAARRRVVNLRNQADFAGVSAENVREEAGTIIPGLSAATTLIGGGSRVARSFAQRSRFPRV